MEDYVKIIRRLLEEDDWKIMRRLSEEDGRKTVGAMCIRPLARWAKYQVVGQCLCVWGEIWADFKEDCTSGRVLPLGGSYIWEDFTSGRVLHLGGFYLWEAFTSGRVLPLRGFYI